MSNFKLGYKPSKNEFLLLMGLLIIALIALALNFFILPQWDSFTQAQDTYQMQSENVANLRTQFASLDTLVEDNRRLEEELSNLRAVIPNYYSQEEIIVMLDEISAQSGLDVGAINFGGVLLQPMGDFELGLVMTAPGGESSVSDTQQEGADAAADGISEVRSEKITVSFSGSYRELRDFLFSIESETRKVYYRNLALNRADDGTLTGTIDILAFGSVNEEAQDYPDYTYDSPAAEGKDDPFAAFDGYESGDTATGAAAQDNPEFYLILNTYDDNANKILMGQYPLSSTQVTSDANKNVTASLRLSGTSANCSYTYTLGGESHSGTLQLADGEAMTLSVLSRDRKNSADDVGVTLSVENNLDITLNIDVSNDDATDPRFVLGSTSGAVKTSR